MTNNIPDFLNVLAQKLNVAVDTLWAALLRQAPIDSAFGLTMLLVVTAWVLFLWKKCLAWMKTGPDEMAVPLVLGGLVILTGVAVLCWALTGSTILAGFFNPEFWALQRLLPAH